MARICPPPAPHPIARVLNSMTRDFFRVKPHASERFQCIGLVCFDYHVVSNSQGAGLLTVCTSRSVLADLVGSLSHAGHIAEHELYFLQHIEIYIPTVQ